MRKVILLLPLAVLGCGNAPEPANPVDPFPQEQAAMNFHQLSATDINGRPYDMAQLKGRKVMVVNTASECGFTPQYEQLEELYERYKDKGFVILGFPSNDFGGQEPGDEKTIAAFCEKNYGVTFPLMSKIATKGPDQSPVYAWLTRKKLNGKLDSEVKWNFQKYLIDEDGNLVTMYPSAQEPLSAAILKWLDAK
ncbi:MAG: glutathione peroxidase [Flavobacteriales bacterium]|jgi:glutathione peroxidase|nr:glutathione peroxidase [Flavobacteriales bacterium]MCB0758044.1 glutathione peroxidase [Flavobacteriales bacterium]